MAGGPDPDEVEEELERALTDLERSDDDSDDDVVVVVTQQQRQDEGADDWLTALIVAATGGGLLAAMIWAAGAVLVLAIMAFLFWLVSLSAACGSGSGGGGGCGPCCCDDCCDGGCCIDACCDGCCDGVCDGCCQGCTCATVVAPGVATGRGWRDRLDALLAHHPDLPPFREDVFRVSGVRVCIGCATTYPAFLLVAGVVAFTGLPFAWWLGVALGAAGASAQAISSAGLARRRWQKFAVKGLLGSGLALVLFGVRAAPWHPVVKFGVLLGVLGVALLSTVPRRPRMVRQMEAYRADPSPGV